MTKTLRLGVAGLGTVGTGLVHLLNARSQALKTMTETDIVITGVSARNKNKDRGIDCSDYQWFEDANDLARQSDIDVFVELIGGEDGIAKQSIETAIQAGKHVVTANKALLALHGARLARLAEDKGVALNFEAAVAGGIPIVKTMRESLVGNDVKRVYGILNGTCNYILTRMESEGRPFDEILQDAQEAGYAEADPTFDIGGIDAAHKLALLTSLAFGSEPDYQSIFVEGIQFITPHDIKAASDLGFRIKLLGVATQTDSGIEQRVHPSMVPKHSALAEVDGVTNCVAVEGDFVGDILLVGPGAGDGPTASSVMSDITDIARGVRVSPFIRPVKDLTPYKNAKMRAHEGGYYIRLAAHDKPGVFAAIAHRMAERQISLKSIVQLKTDDSIDKEDKTASEGSLFAMPIVMITHDTTEESMKNALAAIEADGHVDGKPQMIRIEKL